MFYYNAKEKSYKKKKRKRKIFIYEISIIILIYQKLGSVEPVKQKSQLPSPYSKFEFSDAIDLTSTGSHDGLPVLTLDPFTKFRG